MVEGSKRVTGSVFERRFPRSHHMRLQRLYLGFSEDVIDSREVGHPLRKESVMDESSPRERLGVLHSQSWWDRTTRVVWNLKD